MPVSVPAVFEEEPLLKHAFALSVGLVALTFGVASPAMAQMKTSKPATPEVVAPATSSATPSVEVLPATPSATTSLPVAAAPAAPAGGGFSWPKSPVPISVGANYDFGGSLNTGGFEALSVSGGGATTQVPGLGNAKPAASGNGFGVELGLPVVTLGARLQNYAFDANPAATFNDPAVPQGATVTKPATLGAFLPTNYQEVYAKVFGLSVGYRNETYGGAGNYAGTYGNLMLGLNVIDFNLLDTLGVNVGLKGGYSLSKPSTLPAGIIHVPVDGDANVSFKLAMVKAKLGYKAAAAVNAAPGDLFSALLNPGSLVPSNGSAVPQETFDNLTATRYGLYTGPYLGLELGF
ncbi:hypothetical protein D3C86_1116720 [compost metagenome]